MNSIRFPENAGIALGGIEDSSFWFQQRNRIILSVVNRFAKGRSFVDVGGGGGVVSKALMNEGYDVCLVEPLNSSVEVARKRGVSKIIPSTLQESKLEENSISNLGLFDVLEHISHDSSYLLEVRKYLSKDGLIFITVPAYKWLWNYDDVYAGHVRRYTLYDLRQLLLSSGFQIIFGSYFFSPLVLPSFLMRTIPHYLFRRQALSQMALKNSGRNLPLLNGIMNWEVDRIKSGRCVPVGTSCLVVGSLASPVG